MDIICSAAIGKVFGGGCAGIGVGVTFACAGIGAGVTFACAGAGFDAGEALACAGAGVSAGFGFARAGTAAGARVAFAMTLGFFADSSFSGVLVGAGVAVAPCVAAGVAQDCHGQHIALAGSVISINADAAKGTVNFAFIEPLCEAAGNPHCSAPPPC
jgi:hypothetical protein